MLNAKSLIINTAILVAILIVGGVSRIASWLLLDALGFLYAVVVFASLTVKPKKSRRVTGFILLLAAHWVAWFLVVQLNLGFAYTTNPVLLYVSWGVIEAMLMILALHFAWSIPFGIEGALRQAVYTLPAALIFLALLFQDGLASMPFRYVTEAWVTSIWCCGFSAGLLVNDKSVKGNVVT